MAMADDHPSDDLESREPTVEDLRDLCRELNLRGARYVVIGGFAIRAASYIRSTMDVDLLVAADAENEARVFAAVATLPDHAARELQPGELLEHNVIRVADENRCGPDADGRRHRLRRGGEGCRRARRGRRGESIRITASALADEGGHAP